MNPEEEKTNSEITNSDDVSSKKKQKAANYINEQIPDIKLDEKTKDSEEEYKFGWSSYSEITNGRFAMIGFIAIILIELLSKQSFLQWAGLL